MELTGSKIGEIGELEVVKYLKEKGYSIVAQNYDLPMGEIDVVAKKGGHLYFVEVKTSVDTGFDSFSPEQRVDKRKRQRLQGLAEMYLIREGVDPKTEWQIDVVAVTIDREGKLTHIEHIENAIWDHRGV
jgi:putative endonuclease